jgi:hypothetical protein
MSAHTVRRLKRIFVGAFVVMAIATLVGFDVIASEQAAARDDPARLAEARRAKILSMAEPLLARGENVQELKEKLAELSASARRGAAELKKAELSVEVAKISLNEYLQGVFPSDIQTAEGDVALASSDLARAEDRKAWADKMLKKGNISESEHLADVFALKKAEFAVQQAKTIREVLEKYTKGKEVKRHDRCIKDAEENVAEKKALALLATTKLPALEQQIQDESLTTGETQVLVLLDQVAQLEDKGQTDQADAKIDEAGRLFQTEQARRTELKYKNVMRRVRKRIEDQKGATQPGR